MFLHAYAITLSTYVSPLDVVQRMPLVTLGVTARLSLLMRLTEVHVLLSIGY
jgi:hypothetical protein